MTARTDSEAQDIAEDRRDGRGMPDEVAERGARLTGRLWADAYVVVWPTSGGGGTCSHRAPDSCPCCDGSHLR